MGDKLIIDLWGSNNDSYGPDSYVNVFSSGKSVAAILMGIMVDRGLLDYDVKITKYWPEFGKNNKHYLKVKDILKHEAGLNNFSERVDLDWLTTENIKKNVMGAFIENQEPMWMSMAK